MQKIVPFLWFVDNAEEAIEFYTSVFKDAKVIDVPKLPENVPGPKGKVVMATIELLGQRFLLLNGGNVEGFTSFSPATSFVILCEDQAEVDHYWEKLPAQGGKTNVCGWLTDKFGITWQVTPTRLTELMTDPDTAKAARVADAMMKMTKIDIAELERAAEG
jgi:predicted 3-demethylubiquinone-9 3-methyltransferase (glyoxalase superfamily)